MGAQQQAATTTTTSTSSLEGCVCVYWMYIFLWVAASALVKTWFAARLSFVPPFLVIPLARARTRVTCAGFRCICIYTASALHTAKHSPSLSISCNICTCILKARCRRCAAVPNARVLAFACPYLSTYRCRNARTPAAAARTCRGSGRVVCCRWTGGRNMSCRVGMKRI